MQLTPVPTAGQKNTLAVPIEIGDVPAYREFGLRGCVKPGQQARRQ
jgi:hypothetical protein